MSEGIVVARQNSNLITKQEEGLIDERPFRKFNKVFVSGIIEKEFEYSHKMIWENFYKTRVRVTRPSGIEDLVPLVISEVLIGRDFSNKSFEGKWVEAVGQFRSYNRADEDGRKHLELFLFVMAINIYDNEDELEEVTNANLIYLNGYICKPPVYRKTPLGKEITDLHIAVNRAYGKSDHIPCIAWERTAKWASKLEVGNRVELYGRIRSREYFKRVAPQSEEGEYKEVYEISIMRMQKVDT